MTDEELIKRQRDNIYGVKMIEEIAKRWGVSENVAVNILLDIDIVNDFYNWIHADDFLNRFKYYLEQQKGC